MRNHITLAFLSLVCTAAAQPTFQYTNLPTSTAYYSTYVVTDPGTVGEPDLSGADQVWDFSSITFAQVGSTTLGPSAGSPYAADYPDANYLFASWATGGGDIQYSYLLANATALESIADDVPGTPQVYADHRRVLQFSTTYGNSFTDTYGDLGSQDTVTWTYIGYGTLITSLGTFTDQAVMQNTDGDVFFWNTDPLFPRFIANSDNPVLLVPDASGVNEMGTAAPLHVFPIPAITSVTVEGLQGRAVDGAGHAGPSALARRLVR